MAYLVSVSGVACLVLAAACDVRTRRIPNAFALILVLLGLLRLGLLIAAGSPLAAVPIDLALALGVFLAGAGLFAAGGLGGGDVKLLAATALWLGAAGLAPFLMATTLAGGVLALAKLVEGWISAPAGTPPSLPYGLAIATGGMVAAPGFLAGI